MTIDRVNAEVERVIRHSEVMAVVQASRSGRAPRIGDTLDYSIEHGPPDRRPFRFAVEQRHLDAAKQMLSAEDASGRAHGW